MKVRKNIFASWNMLLVKLDNLKQAARADKSLGPEQRLALELQWESAVCAGLDAVTDTLGETQEAQTHHA
jgi:hypothetical protein